MLISDEITANSAYKARHGEDYPPKNSAYNKMPRRRTPLSSLGHIPRVCCSPRSPVLRPLYAVFGANAAPFGSYDRFYRNLCVTPGGEVPSRQQLPPSPAALNPPQTPHTAAGLLPQPPASRATPAK